MKKIIFIFVCILNALVCSYESYNQASLCLLLHILYDNGNKEASKTPAYHNIYYSGIHYQTENIDRIGGSVQIKIKNISSSINIIISRQIKRKDKNGKPSHLIIPHNKECKWYNIQYVVNEKKGTYSWKIEEIENYPERIPNDAIIIYANPENATIKDFKPSFTPLCPSSGAGVIVLPSVILDGASQKDSLNALHSLEIKQYHVNAQNS